MKNTIRIATRKSPLAMWQAEHVAGILEKANPGLNTELLPIVTKGDIILDTPLAKIGGKGLFLKELENSLLAGEADIAVHSMKDVPVELPSGLVLAVIMSRESPFDALVSNNFSSFEALPENAVVGTSSLRRQAQVRHLRPDLRVKDLRGNVNTRLGKLDANEYDAIILAEAGLVRLQFSDRITEVLSPPTWLPAAAQGALGIECREGDAEVLELITVLKSDAAWASVQMERSLNRRLGGSCQVPIAAWARSLDSQLQLEALVASVDGRVMIRDITRCEPQDADLAATQLAEKMLADGARDILASLGISPP